MKYHLEIPDNIITKYHPNIQITLLISVINDHHHRHHHHHHHDRGGGGGEERLRGGNCRHVQGDRVEEESWRILGNIATTIIVIIIMTRHVRMVVQMTVKMLIRKDSQIHSF